MEQITIDTYSFDELSEKVQERVIAEYDTSDDADIFLESSTDQMREKIWGAGFSNVRLYYSLSYSQGDGFSFTARIEDLEKFLRKHKLLTKYRKVVRAGGEFSVVKSRHQYQHKYTVDVAYTLEDCKGSELAEELVKEITAIVHSLCDECEKMGYDAIEYACSREAIMDAIRGHQLRFTKEGGTSYYI